ncbi:MAG: energy transducer TonB [Paludibacteraceae bacterium]|nr:energy transducer TonB [Paludibacteraceae bacterium]
MRKKLVYILRKQTAYIIMSGCMYFMPGTMQAQAAETATKDIADEVLIDPPVVQQDTTVYINVEEMPSFPGGDAALFRFITDNVKYPSICLNNHIQGNVVCRFIVETDGSITDVEVVRSSGDEQLDKEAVRLMRFMPKWSPAKISGKPVRAVYYVPVHYKIKEPDTNIITR